VIAIHRELQNLPLYFGYNSCFFLVVFITFCTVEKWNESIAAGRGGRDICSRAPAEGVPKERAVIFGDMKYTKNL